MKASDLFIQALENEGVEYIFGIPGGRKPGYSGVPQEIQKNQARSDKT